MMRTLILMRHAKSSWKNPTLSDHIRPLNSRGRTSARIMGDWLRARDYLPDTAISSSSARTIETFEQLRLNRPVVYTDALYHAEPQMMMEVLRAQESVSVLMLGHNPAIAQLANHLVTAPPLHPHFDNYPTCATTVICFDLDLWRNADWHQGQVIDFAIPREIFPH